LLEEIAQVMTDSCPVAEHGTTLLLAMSSGSMNLYR
jgi:hypothetical protein